jgi:hypothetical protein
MSLPTYVTVPFDRTITFWSSPAPSSTLGRFITQHPAFLPSSTRRTAPERLRRENASSQKRSARMSLSLGSRSYRTPMRSIVRR